MPRVWHHLRVREQVSPGRWVKKSKFYEGRSPSDAVRQYLKQNGRVGHTIMWCEKDRRHDPERLADEADRIWRDIRAEQERRPHGHLGDVGGFLRLGGELFQELRRTERKENKKGVR